ncbi:MAG: macro domain-containing protein [Solobacterium sp.]|nr:macro domain-containing protein [Solobacterium sp.]
MPLKLIRDDITRVSCDAIVNASDNELSGGGGVDAAIHKAAGPEMDEACRKLNGCPDGEARITKGYDLPCRYVIHTAGPVYVDGLHHEEQVLRNCYRNSLNLAKEYQCESVAFPLISAGVFGYPKEEALQTAISEITSFVMANDMLVYLVVFDQKVYQISSKLYVDIQQFIDEKYAAEHYDETSTARRRRHQQAKKKWSYPDAMGSAREAMYNKMPAYSYASREERAEESLEERLKVVDESFSEMLLRKIDEAGISDSECYKKANIDRKLFSKIRSNRDYRPSKPTVLAFAIALELPLKETEEMLMKAGFALSSSSKFDIIVEYFIRHGNYDIFAINDALFAFDQPTLGV